MHEISNNVVCATSKASDQPDQSLCLSLEYSMTVKLLTKHHLESLRLIGGCTGSSESTHVKMPHCWKSHVMAHLSINLIRWATHHLLSVKAVALKFMGYPAKKSCMINKKQKHYKQPLNFFKARGIKRNIPQLKLKHNYNLKSHKFLQIIVLMPNWGCVWCAHVDVMFVTAFSYITADCYNKSYAYGSWAYKEL